MSAVVEQGTGIALRLIEVNAAYGSIPALHRINLEVKQGQIVALLGANGAGKSTTLRVISGMLKPTSGVIEFCGQNIAGHSPASLVRQGLIHSPEGRQIFGETFTVEDNLRAGAFSIPQREFKEREDWVLSIFPVLADRKKQRAATLSGGEQQMLAIARALMGNPRMLLLDEPSLGLAPLVTQDIFRTVAALNRDNGVTVLVVEQNVSVALDVAHYAYVLETGMIAVEGTPDELRAKEDVRRSYLGY